MTEIRQEAMRILESIPEEHMDQAVDMLRQFYNQKRPLTDEEWEEKLAKRRKALANIMAIANSRTTEVPADFDYKNEVAEALEEKYGITD